MYRTSLIHTEGEKKKESNKKGNIFFSLFQMYRFVPSTIGVLSITFKQNF